MDPVDTPNRNRQSQPRNFWNLSFTEAWERFSYYGLQGVLTYYLLYNTTDGGLGLTNTTAVSIVGAYGGSLYLAQLLGAWLADRLITARHLVLTGAIIITSGHLCLALIPGITGLITGLTCIAIGTGLLKTNITSLIGVLFTGWNRTHRDAGFSYYYLAMNIGAIAGPLLTGWLQSSLGFHYAFGLAAIGMTIALTQYCIRMHTLPATADTIPNPIDAHALLRRAGITAIAVCLIIAAIASGIIDANNLNWAVGAVIALCVTGYFTLMLRSPDIDGAERTRVAGYLPLWLGETLYYGLWLQLFTTVPLIVSEHVDLSVGGWDFPVAWFSVVGEVALVLVIPLLAGARWRSGRLGALGPAHKFTIGFALIGVAYLMMWPAAGAGDHAVSVWWILLCLIVAGVSEAFVGPIGFSVVAEVAPARFATQLVALKILCLGAGSTLSALFALLYTAVPATVFFPIIGAVAAAACALLLTGDRPLRRRLYAGLRARL
nr:MULTISPECIES: oligopeptide:H+ symporter [unclassified Brevibacterium]